MKIFHTFYKNKVLPKSIFKKWHNTKNVVCQISNFGSNYFFKNEEKKVNKIIVKNESIKIGQKNFFKKIRKKILKNQIFFSNIPNMWHLHSSYILLHSKIFYYIRLYYNFWKKGPNIVEHRPNIRFIFLLYQSWIYYFN